MATENLLNVSVWHWLAFGGLVVILLVLDLQVFHRHLHTPTFLESALWSVFWIGLALVFNGLVWWWGYATHGDSEAGMKFLAGFLVEKSLSLDNLFVFAVIFRYFQVPLMRQYPVLFWGIIGAIVLRLAFVLAGVGLIERFDWMTSIFGVFLLYTGVKLALPQREEIHPENNVLLRAARRMFSMSTGHRTDCFFVRENGGWRVTPLFLVLLVVESTDVLFAVDSVPAVIGITKDPFIVFTSNIFAILGLRALYFLLAGAVDRFRYLHFGLAAVLVFVGGKMIAEYVAESWLGHKGGPLVPVGLSLAVIAVLLALAIGASIMASRREAGRTIS